MEMVSPKNQMPSGLSELELPQLLSFNDQVKKLVVAGVPIRFPGAPSHVPEWLGGISKRVALNVGLGQSPSTALSSDPSINPAYLTALAAWLESRKASDATSVGSLQVLEPWVQSGLQGDRQVDKSGLYAFWLWLVALMASIVMIHSVWVMFPKLKIFYENSGLQIGIGYRWSEWIYDRLGLVASVLAAMVLAAPVLWRLWFQRIAKHWRIPSYTARVFFLVYLLLGGAMTALLGWTVLWPVVELLIQVGEPRS